MGQFLLFWEIWLTLRNCKYVVGILAIYHLCLSIFSCTWNTVLKIAINKHYLKIVIQSQRLTFEYNFCYQLIIFFDLNVFMYLKYLMMLAIVTLPSIFALYASIFSFQISNVGICMATSWLGLFHQSSEIWQSFTICTFFIFIFLIFFHISFVTYDVYLHMQTSGNTWVSLILISALWFFFTLSMVLMSFELHCWI